jgi:hypothetical protein
VEAHRRWLRPVGVLLLLPLAGAVLAGFVDSTQCEIECGDRGKGWFILWLLCTPPAAAGVLALAATAKPGRPRAAGLPGLLGRLAKRTVIAMVLVCTLMLVVAAIAALNSGVEHLTTEPQIHHIGQTEPSQFDRESQRDAGIWWLIVGTVLAAMATTAVLALWAAARKRR